MAFIKDVNMCRILRLYFIYVMIFQGHVYAQDNDFVTAKDAPWINNGASMVIQFNTTDGLVNDLTETFMVVIAPGATFEFRVENISTSVRFVLFQAHTQGDNLTLAYNETVLPSFNVNGSNVGLVQMLTSETTTSVYVKNFNDRNITTLLVSQAYGRYAPIPGGCNMEFPVEISPFLLLGYTDAFVWVEDQPASPPLGNLGGTPTCDVSSVDHEMYHTYMPERESEPDAFFETLKNLLTVDDIIKNGRKVSPSISTPMTRRLFAAYPGTGTVITVVAKSRVSPYGASAYVPVATYACSWAGEGNSCIVLEGTYARIFCAFVIFMGLFVCFVGHRFFKSQMFLFGLISAIMISYIILEDTMLLGYTAQLGVATVFGLLGGLLWLSVWWFWGIPVISVLLVNLMLGFFVACIMFFAGVADVPFFESDFNYWMTLGCVMLFVPVLTLSFTDKANIISCAVIGSYAVIYPIDHYIGSNLRFIIVNNIRRATVREFKTAVIDPPFQTKDIILTVVWILLALMGISLQLYLQTGRAPFPPPPYLVCKERRRRHLTQAVDSPAVDIPSATERTPLLLGDAQQTYSSSQPVAAPGIQARPSVNDPD